ncbi:hypothetical protein [Chryseosolibacter indicus]|uniref:YhhN-like protein n=1 Tax=Chryseosolibacter indicus TaxID=2782351 RepID=A0ABS5VUH0_9BACT|nr:hypothetical protein [Chryseosolibacter indicus]MBT1705069.1 hypothetical protein [Chryseosolibacter indicus]
MSASFPEIIRLVSTLSVALPLFFYFKKYKHATRALHLVGALTLVAAFSDLLAYILFAQGKSTIILFNIYYTTVFLLLSWFYYEILPTKGAKNLVIAGLFLYAAAFVVITSYFQSFFVYQTYMWSITGFFMIVYSMSYFFHLFSTQTTMSNFGLLTINSSTLFYFSFNLFLFVMSSYVLLKMEHKIAFVIWSFHNINNIVRNVLIGLGISIYSKEGLTRPVYTNPGKRALHVS